MSLQFVCVCVCVCLVFLTELLHDKISLSKEHHKQTDCNDIWPQTAQFHNQRISTDLNLVTWQSIVQEPPEDGLKMGPKNVGTSF
jgi:hypothetical protein